MDRESLGLPAHLRRVVLQVPLPFDAAVFEELLSLRKTFQRSFMVHGFVNTVGSVTVASYAMVSESMSE